MLVRESGEREKERVCVRERECVRYPREGAARDTDTGGSTSNCNPPPASVYGDPPVEIRTEYSPGARAGAWQASAVLERRVAAVEGVRCRD